MIPIHFQLRIGEVGRYYLSRDDEEWTREFPKVQDAMAFAKALPDSTGASATVVDENGAPFVTLAV